ncbi:MAG: GumC family protein [Candidatus Zixiibacteriota bacterium]
MEKNNQDTTNIFLDWFIALLRHKKLIIFNTILVLLISYGIARLLPVWYSGQAAVLPPYNRSATIPGMGGLGGMLGISGSEGDFALPLMATQTDLWAAIVKSPALMDTLIAEEDLMERYDAQNLKSARDELDKHIKVDGTKEGILRISAEDKDPEFAAYLTNRIVDELNKIITTVKTTVSGATREFLETRLEETRKELRRYEDSLASFQSEHGAIAIEDQAKVIIESAAQIQAELLITDVELGIARRSYSEEHSKTRNLHVRKQELQQQLKKIEYGKNSSSNFLNIPLVQMPDLALEYARLVRETMAREVLYSFIMQQYEQARIDEKRDTPSIQILARAVTPDEKSRPKRTLIAIIAAFLVFLMTSAYVIFLDYLNSISETEPEKFSRLETIKNNLFTWKFREKSDK